MLKEAEAGGSRVRGQPGLHIFSSHLLSLINSYHFTHTRTRTNTLTVFISTLNSTTHSYLQPCLLTRTLHPSHTNYTNFIQCQGHPLYKTTQTTTHYTHYTQTPTDSPTLQKQHLCTSAPCSHQLGTFSHCLPHDACMHEFACSKTSSPHFSASFGPSDFQQETFIASADML